MRDHEIELIAALAEGRLEDETDARALVASSDEAQAEYEAQKFAIDALAHAETAAMSDVERSALRRDVWTELRTPPQEPTAARPWYYRWMPVAAGMILVVGLVAVVSQGGGLDRIVTADQGAAETTLAGTETTETMADALDGDDDSGGGAVTEAPTDRGGEAGDGDLGQALPPEAAAFFSAAADDIRAGEETQPESQELETPSPSELEDCLARAGLEGYEIHDVKVSPDETDEPGVEVPEEAVPYIAATPVAADLPTAAVVFVDLDACEVIHVDQ